MQRHVPKFNNYSGESSDVAEHVRSAHGGLLIDELLQV